MFLKSRTDRQADAKKQIAAALEQYNVGAVDTLIGDITPPDDLMKTLTDRKLAEQERVTYETQRQAEVVRKELQQARAVADTQAKVVDSERSVAIAEFAAQASIKQAEGAARAKTMIANADADVIKLVGFAEAEKTQKIGTAEASVIKQKADAISTDSYVAIEVARAIAGSSQKLVPDIMASGQGGGSSTIVEMLMASVVKDHLGSSLKAPKA